MVGGGGRGRWWCWVGDGGRRFGDVNQELNVLLKDITILRIIKQIWGWGDISTQNTLKLFFLN